MLMISIIVLQNNVTKWKNIKRKTNKEYSNNMS